MDQNESGSIQTDEDRIIKSQMEQMVDSYDSYMRTMTFGRERALREMTVSLAQIQPGETILEVGCGTGTLTLAAKRKAGLAGKVFGIDIIPGMIDYSRKKAAQARADISFQLGSIDEIPFPADQFDAVLCSFMIFHMSDGVRRKGLAEIHRVLKPDGRLLILDLSLPTAPVSRTIARALFGGMLEHDLRELLPLMGASDFADVEIAPAKFRVMGLSVLAYIRGRARKG